MNNQFRVLVAVKDERTRVPMEGLLKTVKAKQYTAETAAAVMTYLSMPEGMDLIVIDEAWNEISVEATCRMSRTRPDSGDAYLVVLISGADVAAALLAFNAGADAVLRKPIDPIEFLNACRAGQRVAVTSKRHVSLEKAVMAAAAEVAAEKEAKVKEEAKKHAPSRPLAEVDDNGAEPESRASRGGASVVLGSEDTTAVYTLIEQLQESIHQTFIELGVPEKNCNPMATVGKERRGEFVGWQGAFCPGAKQWLDILFYFSRAAVEGVSQRITGRKAQNDVEAIAAIGSYLGNLQSTYKKLYRRAESASSIVLCQPLSLLRLDWISEAGHSNESQTFNLPEGEVVADFHLSPGAFCIKTLSDIKPGDVLGETVAAASQQRIPLVSRGVVLTAERLKKIEFQVESTRNFWVIEPSLLARRLSGEIVG